MAAPPPPPPASLEGEYMSHMRIHLYAAAAYPDEKKKYFANKSSVTVNWAEIERERHREKEMERERDREREIERKRERE
jgi:hypothetical protein